MQVVIRKATTRLSYTGSLLTMMSSSAPSFSHEERIRIVIDPFANSATVRLEATSSLFQPHVNRTTSFPPVIKQLVQDYGVSRILLQTGSISSFSFDTEDPLEDQWSTGPSGVSVLVKMRDADRFPSLLRALVGHRLLLAPLEAIDIKRLHRCVYKRQLIDGSTQMQIILPFEGSAVASEGVKEFLSVTSPCPLNGILSSENAKALSHVLLGDASDIAVAHKKRRSMWMDIQSTCNTCEMSIKRGLQYTVLLSNDGLPQVSLSQLVPMSSFKKCPVTNKSQLTVILQVQTEESLSETAEKKRFLETAIDDWNIDSVLNYSSEQATSKVKNSEFYGDRTLFRPLGVANSGRLVTRIGTKGMECPTKVHVLEVLPPYLLPLWDTWTLGTKPLLSLQPDGTIVVEWTTELPPETDFEVMMDYEPVLLPFQQFPGDPNRGIELPPTQFVFESECVTGPVKLYSSPLLLMPPVQDMSMPFNVISLSCTLYAFIIGSLANLLVRKASEKVKQTLHPEPKKSKLRELKERLRNKLGLDRTSKSVSKAQKGAEETSQMSSSKDHGDEVSPNVTTEEVKTDASE